MPQLGRKYTCYSCHTKFYDLGKPEPLCPKCGADQRDAEETVAALVEDLRGGALPEPEQPSREAIDALLAERQPDHVTVEGWRAIDAHERTQAEDRPRVKLTTRDELLERARSG